MNCNLLLFILVLIIIYMYYTPQKVNNKTKKINPKDFNPAIHHPAAL